MGILFLGTALFSGYRFAEKGLVPITTAFLILSILFLAAFIKSTLGFGESLVTIPLLTLVLGVQMATPLISLIAATITLLIMIRSWDEIEFGATWRLTLSAAFGVPAGIWGLSRLPSSWLVNGLGMILILTGLYYLARPALPPIQHPGWAYLFGFLSGLLGGAYSMASPPTLVYSTMRRWEPSRFRATVQSFFLPLSGMILIGHAAAGLWTSQLLLFYAISWPIMLLAFWIGSKVGQRLKREIYERVVYTSLIVLGLALILRQ